LLPQAAAEATTINAIIRETNLRTFFDFFIPIPPFCFLMTLCLRFYSTGFMF
jgi:hypothetical protein